MTAPSKAGLLVYHMLALRRRCDEPRYQVRALMSEYVDLEIPFIKLGNRRALTDEQLANHPFLHEFVERFPLAFERHDYLRAWMFIEPEYPNAPTREPVA